MAKANMKRNLLLACSATLIPVVLFAVLYAGQTSTFPLREQIGDTIIASVVPIETYFVVYQTEEGIKIERFTETTLDTVRKFLNDGFVKMIWDGTDCNKCDPRYAGYSSCTTMFCPNYVRDRPKPQNPKLIGIFRGESIPFTTEIVDKKVVVESETIYRVGE